MHYGYLLANIAYSDFVDLHTANWCVRKAQELSWTQFVLLGIVGDEAQVSSLPDGIICQSERRWGAWTLQRELMDIGFGHRELIQATGDDHPLTGIPSLNLNLNDQQLASGGSLLHELMWLDRVPVSEVGAVMEELARKGEAGNDDSRDSSPRPRRVLAW